MEKRPKVELILADDHPLFIKGLIAALSKEFLIIGVAQNGKALLDLLKCRQPDLILLDLQMPDLDGLSAAKQITIDYPEIKIIILSGSFSVALADQLRKVGVKSYLTKDVDINFLIRQINLVYEDEPETYDFKDKKDGISDCFQNEINKYKLSLREKQIISLIKKGLTSKEIGTTLFISLNTVEVHRKHIFKKLGLKKSQMLVEFACKHSL